MKSEPVGADGVRGRFGPASGDDALIRACLAGDREAFGGLVARHRDGVYNFIRHTITSDTDAQDLAQEAFVNAFSALYRFKPGAPFEPWIYRIAANLCVSYFRRNKRRPQSLDSDDTGRTLPAPDGTDPADSLLQRDESRRLRAAIRSLPPDQRMVVVLRHFHDLSYKEIAEVLALPASTVEHRLRAARKALQKRLCDEGIIVKGGDQD